jgi:hypothetical protein
MYAVRRHMHYMRWLYIVFHKKMLFRFGLVRLVASLSASLSRFA